MAYLIIKKKGEDFKEVDLVEDRESIVGRGKDCDIVLEKVKGLSRKHLKIFLNSEKNWVVELLSNLGSLIQGGEERAKIELEDGDAFSVPPYTFLFRLKEKENQKKEKKKIKEIKEEGQESEESPEPAQEFEVGEENFEAEEKIEGKEEVQASQEENQMDSLKLELKDEKLKKAEGQSQILNLESQSEEMSFDLKPQDTVSDLSKNQPVLKITYSNQQEEKISLNCKLKQEWVMGRSQSCDFVLKDKKVSRKHIKIVFKDNAYFVEDLKSINGTYLNDKQLKSQLLEKLASGDQLKIGKVKIQFEDKVKNYSMQLKEIENQVKKEDPFLDALKKFDSPQSSLNEKNAVPLDESEKILAQTIIGAKKVESSSRFGLSSVLSNKASHQVKEKSGKKRKKSLHFIIFFGFIFLGCFIFLQENPSKKKKDKGKDNAKELSSVSQDKASVEEVDPRIKETFLSARKYYMGGKYELCNFEIQRLHKKVDAYENSKELESLCLQAFELRKAQEEKEKLKKEKLLADQKVEKIINDCRSKMNDGITVEEITDCLFPAKEIDPMNTLISDLIFEVELKEQKKEEVRQKKQRYKSRVLASLKAYEFAEKLYREGKFKKALKAYKKFIHSSHIDPYNNKEKARKRFNLIIKNHNRKIEKFLESCRVPFKKSKFQEAFSGCKKVLELLPDNEEAKDIKRKSVLRIQDTTKGLFIDSVLHESVGNLELAIEKWRKIVKISVEGDEYYNRSKRKLTTYEGRL